VTLPAFAAERRRRAAARQPQRACSYQYINMRLRLKVAHTRLQYRVPELILVLGSQPADDASHKPGGRLLLLSARPAVTFATLKRAATNFAPW